MQSIPFFIIASRELLETGIFSYLLLQFKFTGKSYIFIIFIVFLYCISHEVAFHSSESGASFDSWGFVLTIYDSSLLVSPRL